MAKVIKFKTDSTPRTPSKSKTTKSTKSPPTDNDMPPKAAKKAKATRGGKDKRQKDPNAPKRSLSAYMFYANDNRERVRSENPNITFGQVGKVLGEEWKALTDNEKKKYDKMAKDDKERYEREKAKYNAGEDDEEEGSE